MKIALWARLLPPPQRFRELRSLEGDRPVRVVPARIGREVDGDRARRGLETNCRGPDPRNLAEMQPNVAQYFTVPERG